MHDLGELLTKVRSQLYKVDKRGGNTEAAVSELSKRQADLAERLQALEAAPTAPSGGSGAHSDVQVCDACRKAVALRPLRASGVLRPASKASA